MRFLATDPAWDPGSPPDELIESDFDGGVRFVARPELWPAVGHFLNMGRHVALVLARESGDPEQYAEWGTAEWMHDKLHWIVGNEPDGEGEASWIMSPREYRALWIRSRCLKGERWIAGMCSGDVARAAKYLQADATGLTVHIYGLSAEQAAAKVAEYAALGLSVWVGEFHPDGDEPTEDYWAAFGDVWANFFCYSNAMVAGFGYVQEAA